MCGVILQPGVRVMEASSGTHLRVGEILAARLSRDGDWEFDVKRTHTTATIPIGWIAGPHEAEEPNAPPPPNALSVFLCHASEDKARVRELHRRLRAEMMHPWLDEEALMPGVEWEQAIRQAVTTSDVVLICVSARSSAKKGYLQEEIRIASEVAISRPDGTLLIIPLRLENTPLPDALSRWHAVDLFETGGFERLLLALEKHPCRNRAHAEVDRRFYYRQWGERFA
jgi:hypothetical protein